MTSETTPPPASVIEEIPAHLAAIAAAAITALADQFEQDRDEYRAQSGGDTGRRRATGLHGTHPGTAIRLGPVTIGPPAADTTIAAAAVSLGPPSLKSDWFNLAECRDLAEILLAEAAANG